ncbi:hypothetical protein RHMOL_Rhmol09G0262200 [Rhododendron molle]|uniref:Uncharacterized protein n=1 Tax=Rhododendron molle TaxID=49168 RepID=A0ACC0MH90_RHOML|nr:hypothetical protein RHMOL_Rhmol09G0262200 [Rhododendron molle]
MAQEYKAGTPLAPANGCYRSDQEAGRPTSSELRSQKRKKWLLYGVAFVIFQTGIIVLFSLTVMKVRTPQFHVRSGILSSVQTDGTSTNPPSYNLMLNAVLGVKNTNFGPYKYENSTIYFFYNGTRVGSAEIPDSKAGFRSTKKINVAANLVDPAAAGNSTELMFNILNSGTLPLIGQSTLNGKVELMFVFKKKKAINLDCTMDVNIPTKELQNIQCN